jgi:hypothetical protein
VLAWCRKVAELGSDDPSRSGVVAADGYFRRLRLACGRPHHVLEVPEPLWYRMWPATFVFTWLVRAACRIRGKSLLVATYAIENLPLAEGLTAARVTDRLGNKLQLLDRIAAAVLDWFASRSINHICYGSEAAQINYASALPAFASVHSPRGSRRRWGGTTCVSLAPMRSSHASARSSSSVSSRIGRTSDPSWQRGSCSTGARLVGG